jgi:hypothetical protein
VTSRQRAATRRSGTHIGAVHNFSSNLAGIVTTTFTDVMLAITGNLFIVPLTVRAIFTCPVPRSPVLIGRITPPVFPDDMDAGQAGEADWRCTRVQVIARNKSFPDLHRLRSTFKITAG